MTEAIANALGFAPAAILLAALIFARVGAALFALPAFGEQSIPARIKLAAALSFTVLVGGLLWRELSETISVQNAAILVLSEAAIGLVLGLSLRFLIIALQIAGVVASQSISLSQLFGGGLGPEPQPAYSTLLVVAGLALAMFAGLHVKVVAMFVVSYDLFPLGSVLNPQDIADWGSGHVGRIFSLGLTLAAPFVLVAIVYNVGLGFISKAMPQLMVAFVGAPAISLAGLVMFLLATPIMLGIWLEVFAEQITAPDLGFR